MGEFGEGEFLSPRSLHPPLDQIIIEKKLTFEEASTALHLLGKDESGIRYAYLMLTLNDSKLTDISILIHFKHLLFLDFSGNLLGLDALHVVAELPYLLYLKVERNRLDSGALLQMPHLQVLILNRNHINETCDIKQPFLECLELNYNLLFSVQLDDGNLERLKQLDLRGNHLTALNGTFPSGLRRVYAAMNRVRTVDGVGLRNLTVLHLRDNQIRKLDGFCAMEQLNYLNLRNNRVNKRRQFRKLACLGRLETIVVLGNPVKGEIGEKGEQEQEMMGEDEDKKKDPVRMALLVVLPSLNRIDKELIAISEREVVKNEREQIFNEIMEEESSDEEPPTTTEVTTDYNTESEFVENEETEIEDD